MKILIAEDDVTSRLFMRKFLERYGECFMAMNGIEAVDLAADAIKSNDYFDLMCLDIMMPKVDGIKALTTIRHLEKTSKKKLVPAKIIMTTALNDKVTVEEAYEAGCDAYAWKPIDIEKFKEELIKIGLPIE